MLPNGLRWERHPRAQLVERPCCPRRAPKRLEAVAEGDGDAAARRAGSSPGTALGAFVLSSSLASAPASATRVRNPRRAPPSSRAASLKQGATIHIECMSRLRPSQGSSSAPGEWMLQRRWTTESSPCSTTVRFARQAILSLRLRQRFLILDARRSAPDSWSAAVHSTRMGTRMSS